MIETDEVQKQDRIFHIHVKQQKYIDLLTIGYDVFNEAGEK